MSDRAIYPTSQEEITNVRPRREAHKHPWLRAGAFVLMFLLLSFSGAVASVCVLGRSLYSWHGFAVELRLLPTTIGQTRLVLTPLGEVRARTHAAPVALVASLEEIQIEEISKLLKTTPDPDNLAKDFEKNARADLENFIARQLALASLGALMAPIFLRCRRLRAYIFSSLLGVAGTGFVLWSAISSFNGKAFDSPVYTGALKQAPWVIQFGKDAFTKIDALSTKLRNVAGNLNVLYGRIAAMPDRLIPGNDASTLRVLHVSDIHNNPAAIDFLQEVAHQFQVAFIVDTGDLTDFGSPPETVLVKRIAQLPYRYVFVAGNHDSQAVMAALAKVPKVTVLNGQSVEVDGLSLLGLPNPASARTGAGGVDTTPAELKAGGEALMQLVKTKGVPDILAIHDPQEAEPLLGKVPLILCGHEHRYYVTTFKNNTTKPVPPTSGDNTPAPLPTGFATVTCNAGTTGAAGLRYLDTKSGMPFSCAVLTFTRPAPVAPSPTTVVPNGATTPAAPSTTAPTPRPQLRAIDLIVLQGSLGEYSISHITMPQTGQTPNMPPP